MNQKRAKMLRAVAKAAAPGGVEIFYERLKKNYRRLGGSERAAYEKRAKVFLAERGVVLPTGEKDKSSPSGGGEK